MGFRLVLKNQIKHLLLAYALIRENLESLASDCHSEIMTIFCSGLLSKLSRAPDTEQKLLPQ